jgi:steroid delta-isomerase-like uncharacterized protein
LAASGGHGRLLANGDREGGRVEPKEMRRIFDVHRDAEARRDFDGILATFTEDCYLETVALGSRSDGQEATKAAYVGYFTAFPDLAPTDEGFAYGDNALVSWGHLSGTSGGEWLGLPPTGGQFRVAFTNVARFADGRMQGETLYFDLATLCEQAGLPLEKIRAAAARRRATAQPLEPRDASDET